MTVVRNAAGALFLIGFLAAAGPFVAQGADSAALKAKFRELDVDGDGKLDGAEAVPVKDWLEGADLDEDGFYTLDEVQTHALTHLAAFQEPASAPQPGAEQIVEPPTLDSPREGPATLAPNDHLIGTFIPDVALADLDGAPRSLHSLTGRRPAVIAQVSTSCPVSKRYLPVLARLATACAGKGVAVVLVAQDATDSADDLRAALQDLGVTAPCVRDSQHTLLKTLGALTSTDTFLLDAASTLVYRGAVDDQYGLGYSLDQPRHRLLEDALTALLAGRQPDVPATSAPGCALDLSEATATALAPTYSNRISRLVQAHCQECHRAGGAGPFPLETYEQVAAKSGMVRRMVERRLMPPWFAAEPAPGESSPWANDRSLSDRDRADLFAWLDAGKPLGDPEEAPLPRTYPAEWKIGTPDVVLQLSEPIEVQAEGTMPWQDVYLPTHFTEDRWVSAVQVQPKVPQVVHHVLVNAREGEDLLTFYAPSNDHVIYPPGFAKRVPAGANLRFEIHYTPNGTAVTDQMRIGLVFADGPPEHEVHGTSVRNKALLIPPGVKDYPVKAFLTIDEDMTLLSFVPHMHLRGSAFRYEATLPDGTTLTLLDVPRYDFNWQMTYRYSEPVTIPRGSTVRATAWYDNSPGNPANPDPTAEVRWGRNTTDEMLLGYIEYYHP